MSERVEQYLKLFPLVTFSLIVAGSAKINIYYKVFGIEITQYLDVTEYLPLFLDDLLYFVLAIVFLIIGIFWLYLSNELNKAMEHLNNPDIFFINSYKTRLYNHIILFLCFIIGPILWLIFKSNVLSFIEYFTVFYIIIIITTFYEIFSFHKTKIFSIFSKEAIIRIKRFAYLVWFVGTISSSLALVAYKEAYQIIDGVQEKKYTVKFKSDKPSLNPKFRYIGNSENYIYFYNVVNEKSIIRRMSDVDEIEVSNKK